MVEAPNYVIEGDHTKYSNIQLSGVVPSYQEKLQDMRSSKSVAAGAPLPSLENFKHSLLNMSFTPIKDLKSVLKEFEVIYSKFPSHIYTDFNVITCDSRRIPLILAGKDKSLAVERQLSKKQPKRKQSGEICEGKQDNQERHLQVNHREDWKQNLNELIDDAEADHSAKAQQQLSGEQQITPKHKPARRISVLSKSVVVVSESTVEASLHVEEEKNNLSSTDPSLIKFDSRFEGGNLAFALRESSKEYRLVLQNDINTKGFTQWFYFKVSQGGDSSEKRQRIKFNIVNLSKMNSLFKQGMKVMVHSAKLQKEKGLGWHRGCVEISYTKNNYKREAGKRGGGVVGRDASYYTLSFSYDFDPKDVVFFAYNFPYSYSDLQQYLLEVESDPQQAKYLRRKLLCRTLAQNRVDLLTITDAASNAHLAKQTVVVSARVHPGETVSSFMIKGFIDFLLSNDQKASYLRNNFVFKIIPMLNPDGVVHGNYRCSLSGKDLNRQWRNPDKETFVEIYYLKKLILEQPRLALFCDLHGHSIKKNIFIYGCHDQTAPSACRELPYILSKLYQPFSFKDCNFAIKQDKQGTARVALWKSLKIPNIFTLESSFCGPSYHDFHFALHEIESMGKALAEALIIYFEPSLSSSESDSQSSKINSAPFRDSLQLLRGNQHIKLEDIQSELNNNKKLLESGLQDTSGSDSEPSGDEIDIKSYQHNGKDKKSSLSPNKGKISKQAPFQEYTSRRSTLSMMAGESAPPSRGGFRPFRVPEGNSPTPLISVFDYKKQLKSLPMRFGQAAKAPQQSLASSYYFDDKDNNSNQVGKKNIFQAAVAASIASQSIGEGKQLGRGGITVSICNSSQQQLQMCNDSAIHHSLSPTNPSENDIFRKSTLRQSTQLQQLRKLTTREEPRQPPYDVAVPNKVNNPNRNSIRSENSSSQDYTSIASVPLNGSTQALYVSMRIPHHSSFLRDEVLSNCQNLSESLDARAPLRKAYYHENIPSSESQSFRCEVMSSAVESYGNSSSRSYANQVGRRQGGGGRLVSQLNQPDGGVSRQMKKNMQKIRDPMQFYDYEDKFSARDQQLIVRKADVKSRKNSLSLSLYAAAQMQKPFSSEQIVLFPKKQKETSTIEVPQNYTPSIVSVSYKPRKSKRNSFNEYLPHAQQNKYSKEIEKSLSHSPFVVRKTFPTITYGSDDETGIGKDKESQKYWNNYRFDCADKANDHPVIRYPKKSDYLKVLKYKNEVNMSNCQRANFRIHTNSRDDQNSVSRNSVRLSHDKTVE